MATHNLRHFIDLYLAPHPSQEVRALFVSTAVLDFAVASIAIFEPIYLWRIGYSLPQIAAFFAVLYAAYFFLLPLGARISRSRGNEHAMLYSSPFLIAYYLAFFAIGVHPAFMAVAILALCLQKTLYWPGYHSNFAQWSNVAEEGREISNRQAIAAAAAMFAPAFGGLVIAWFGFRPLFIIVALLILLSNLPLLGVAGRFEAKGFAYGEAMARLAKPENRKRFFAFFGFGEELIGMVFWPVFLALVIPDTFSLGMVVSFAMFATAAMTLYVGRATDEGSKRAVLRTGVLYTGLAWLVRVFVVGGVGAFLADAMYRVSKNGVNIPIIALIYDGARKRGVMESVIFFEQALAVGKTLAALACMAVFAFAPNPWTAVFLLGAAFTAFFMLMPAEEWKEVAH